MQRLITFLKEVRAELAKVVWPTRSQLIRYTGVVIGISLFFALYLGGVDALLSWIIGTFAVR
jgi:preprotein translocase subunit SecE